VVPVEQQLRNRYVILAEVKDCLLQSQALMKRLHDKKHRNLKFAVGD
jgi:hypothetical protein